MIGDLPLREKRKARKAIESFVALFLYTYDDKIVLKPSDDCQTHEPFLMK
jgi:hypothetical protein